LSPEQHRALADQLKACGSFTVAVRHYDNQEGQDYADDFSAALKDGGWTLRDPQFLIPIHLATGIFILVPDMKSPPPGAVQLQNALKAAGITSSGAQAPMTVGTFDLGIGDPVPDASNSAPTSPTPDKP
jgi:hypothetical protein